MKTRMCPACSQQTTDWFARGVCAKCYGEIYRAENRAACNERVHVWKSNQPKMQMIRVHHESLIRKYFPDDLPLSTSERGQG
jgi:hypothetical protein